MAIGNPFQQKNSLCFNKMKLIDSIHEASKDPRRAQEIASKSSIALIVDAVVLAALILGAIWLLKSASKVFSGEVTTAIEAFVVFLFIVVIGGGLFILVRTILHAIPVCIHAINQIEGKTGEDVMLPFPVEETKQEPTQVNITNIAIQNNVHTQNTIVANHNVTVLPSAPHVDSMPDDNETTVNEEETFISLFTDNVKDVEGMENATIQLLKDGESNSDIVIIFYALVKLNAIMNNQAAFIRNYPLGACPMGRSEFSKLKSAVSQAIRKKYEECNDKEDIYQEKFKNIKAELSQYCKKSLKKF